MGSKADAVTKINGHRRCVLEHIAKYGKYPVAHDKETALKTIRAAQKHIAELRAPHLKNIPARPEDTWKP